MSAHDHPSAVVQRQLGAYNAGDIDALLASYATDARLVQRVVMGNLVIDHELVIRTFPEGPGTVEIAIYEVVAGKIQSASVQVSNKRLDGPLPA